MKQQYQIVVVEQTMNVLVRQQPLYRQCCR